MSKSQNKNPDQGSNQKEQSGFSFVNLEYKDYVYVSIIIVLLVILGYCLWSKPSLKALNYDPDHIHPASL